MKKESYIWLHWDEDGWDTDGFRVFDKWRLASGYGWPSEEQAMIAFDRLPTRIRKQAKLFIFTRQTGVQK